MDDLKKELCKRINHRINVRGYCVVYDHDLAHIWPPEAALRQKQIELIEKFAAQNGLAVIIRDTGLNATFKKKLSPREQEKADERNGDTATTQLETANELAHAQTIRK
jgi:hypothetical protein